MAYERITDSKEFDGSVRASHEYRYAVAARFIGEEDTVVDAACGTSYARNILPGHYVGVDIVPLGGHIVADLRTWKPDFKYEAFVTIETLEHLDDYEHFVSIAKEATKTIVVSTPIIKTVGHNPYHVHDFTMESLKEIFVDDKWKVVHEEVQDKRYGIIVLQSLY